MPILSWQDSYSVGVARIDAEHKQLISMINRAFDDAKSDTNVEVLEKLAADMRMYALVHFATEEALMEQYDFPGSKGHREIHRIFMEQAQAAEEAAASGGTINPIEFINYLADWLNGHILGTDKELGAFLNKQGVY